MSRDDLAPHRVHASCHRARRVRREVDLVCHALQLCRIQLACVCEAEVVDAVAGAEGVDGGVERAALRRAPVHAGDLPRVVCGSAACELEDPFVVFAAEGGVVGVDGVPDEERGVGVGVLVRVGVAVEADEEDVEAPGVFAACPGVFGGAGDGCPGCTFFLSGDFGRLDVRVDGAAGFGAEGCWMGGDGAWDDDLLCESLFFVGWVAVGVRVCDDES